MKSLSLIVTYRQSKKANKILFLFNFWENNLVHDKNITKLMAD